LPDLPEMPCNELVEVLSAYLDGTLPTDDRVRLNAHLAVCRGCSEYVEQFRATIQRVGRLHTGDLPQDTQSELLELFRGWRAA
jgi:anti-sigma factor RsiW